jgi:hypothetical protein
MSGSEDVDMCPCCGWCSELQESHIIRSMNIYCEYIDLKYIVWIDEDGEVDFKLR